MEHRKRIRGRFLAFTLVELLVATAVLVLVILIVVSIVNMTSRMTTLSQKRIDVDAGARQALDRLGVDLSRAVLRKDMPELIEKQTGNDRLMFHTQGDGYGGNRGISKIAYDCQDEKLKRGATGTTWAVADKKPLVFGTGTPSAVGSNDYDVIASEVIRFEVAFLLGNGTIVKRVDRLCHSPGTPAAQQVRALIAGMVALDAKSRLLLTDAEVETLGQEFGDAVDGEDLLQSWNNALDQSSIPIEKRKAVRVYQRYFYLGGQVQGVNP